jgi:hypothetical protein
VADQPKKNGRPTIYSEALAIEFCERMADGRSMLDVSGDEDMPCKTTIRAWCRTNPQFRAMYAQARLDLQDYWADEIIRVADDGTNDWVERQTKNGVVVVLDREHVERSRLRIDARRWVMSKLYAKKYGDKLELAGDPERPLGTPLGNEELLAARLAKHLADRKVTP